MSKYNHALSLFALAVKASEAGEIATAAKALVAASKHESMADIYATVNHQIKQQEKARLSASQSRTSVSKLAQAIAEAQDLELTGEELRVEIQDEKVEFASSDSDEKDAKTKIAKDPEDDNVENSGERHQAAASVARFARALANMEKAGLA